MKRKREERQGNNFVRMFEFCYFETHNIVDFPENICWIVDIVSRISFAKIRKPELIK